MNEITLAKMVNEVAATDGRVPYLCGWYCRQMSEADIRVANLELRRRGSEHRFYPSVRDIPPDRIRLPFDESEVDLGLDPWVEYWEGRGWEAKPGPSWD